MLPFIFLALIHAKHATAVSTNFTVKGGGSIISGKLSMNIHVEAQNVQVPNALTIPTIATGNITGTTPTPALSTQMTTATMPITSALNTTTATPAPGASTVPTTATGLNVTTPGLNSTTAPSGGVTVPPTEQPATATPPVAMYPDKGSSAHSKITFSELDRTALELHNYYRSIHEAPLLSLDESLRKDAQDHAYKVAKTQLLRPEKDTVLITKNEGENLGFRCSVTRPNPARALRQIMKRWYDEGCNYKFLEPLTDRFSHRHFTQLTWNGSQKLGVGIAYGRVKNLQCLYFVARYRPRGNTGAKLDYLKNVRKGVFDSSFCKPIPNHMSKQEVVLKD